LNLSAITVLLKTGWSAKKRLHQ